jgi:hypothetical protein
MGPGYGISEVKGTHMTITQKSLEEVVRPLMLGMDRALAEKFGERVGITMFLTPFGEDHDAPIVYISNISREDMIKAIEIWLVNIKAAAPKSGG